MTATLKEKAPGSNDLLTMRVDVVIPTIDGREELLAVCQESYRQHTSLPDIGVKLNLVVVANRPTAGEAWVSGMRQIEAGVMHGNGRPDLIHLTADDIEAMPGWLHAGLTALEMGVNPCPHQVCPEQGREIWGRSESPVPDGDRGHVNTLPLMKWDDWSIMAKQPFLEALAKLHYYSDDWIAWHMAHLGYDAAYVADYRFIHHFAQHGRGAGMSESARMKHDGRIFAAHINKGSW